MKEDFKEPLHLCYSLYSLWFLLSISYLTLPKNLIWLTVVGKKSCSFIDYLLIYFVFQDTNNNVYNLHTIATSETHASIVIEDSDGILIETIEVDISNYNSINDEYEILWAKSNTNNLYAKTNYDVNDCKTGAATVAAVGRVIVFGSFFGCEPCAFVGGAITTLGSIGFIACVATNS